MNSFQIALLNDVSEVINVTSVGETLAWTWFGRPNYAWSLEGNKYWIGSTKDTPSGTTQHITEYNVNTDSFETYQVGTTYEKDDHNQAQILIRQSDKRLIAFYGIHIANAIRWKISTNPLDASSWGAEKTHSPSQEYSYVSPYQASNGDIFIFYRRRNPTAWSYCKSTDGGLTFGAETIYWQTFGDRNLYNITCQDGDIIHFTATDQHISYLNLAPVDIWHFYFDMFTEKFYTSNGTEVTSLPLGSNLDSKIINTETPNSCWISDIQVKDGKPRILYYLYPNGINNNTQFKDLYFIEWTGSQWTAPKYIIRELDGYIEDDETIESIGYPPAARFDVINKDLIWTSIQVNGILEVHKIDLSSSPIYFEQLTFESEVNNWRPISVGLDKNNLLWLKNNDYNSYTDYSITLQSVTVNR
jgi:hypothetical protein